MGLAKFDFKVKLENFGENRVIDKSITLSGMRTKLEGMGEISGAQSLTIGAAGLSTMSAGIFGALITNVSATSTATSGLFVFQSGAASKDWQKLLAGETTFIKPHDKDCLIHLYAKSGDKLTFEYLAFGV